MGSGNVLVGPLDRLPGADVDHLRAEGELATATATVLGGQAGVGVAVRVGVNVGGRVGVRFGAS